MQSSSAFGLNICLNKATVGGMSGAAATITMANPVVAATNGKVTSTNLSAATAITTDTNTGSAFSPQAASTACCYVIGVDGSGTRKCAQGPIVALDANGNFIVAPSFPNVPDTMTAVGYAIIKNGSTGSNWTFGSSNWNATGITVVGPVDVSVLPSRPQTS